MKNKTLLFLALLAIGLLSCTSRLQKASHKAENFEGFYQRFHKDSLFQMRRVQFPVDGYSIEGGQINAWSSEDWAMHKNGLSAIDTTVYRTERRVKEQEVRERIYQANSGMLIERHFRLIDYRWYLTFYLYVFL